MKNKLMLFALSLVLFSEAAVAQRSRDNDRDRSQVYDNNYNDDDNDAEYGPRRVRYDQDRNYRTAMPSKAFRQALWAIRNENFDGDKLKMARMIARRNHLSTAQIRAIAQSFNFDSSKLAFTKYAYVTCIDPGNYYTLGRIFTFSSSREELYDYIARV